MNKNSFLLKATLGVLILIITFSTNAQISGNIPVVSFTAVPTLISGTDLTIGAKYKFNDIAIGTDAVVTIVNTTGGATLNALDDNNLTMPQAFSPRINLINGATGYVEFKVDLFVAGTSTPKVLTSMAITAIDIDGSKDANGNFLMQELDALDLGAGSVITYQSNNLEIAVTKTNNEYKAMNIAGIEYPAVDTSAKAVMFSLYNTGVSSFTYKAGGYNNFGIDMVRQKAIYFSGFAYTQNTLAVTYKSFTANYYNNEVKLNWATTSETNNKHFEIERSFDGRSFIKIGHVEANDAFISSLIKNYTFTDNDKNLQLNTTAHYRLKQVDANGYFTYSKIETVKLKVNTNISILPNPFIDKIAVQYNAEKIMVMQIIVSNAQGKIIVSKLINANKGLNNIEINNLYNLQAGIYFATLIADGKIIETKKIIK